MKVPRAVMDVLRGLGGAAVITAAATAGAGCAAPAQASRESTVSTNRAPQQKVEATVGAHATATDQAEHGGGEGESLPVPCGRG